jgi:hypothetical protein
MIDARDLDAEQFSNERQFCPTRLRIDARDVINGAVVFGEDISVSRLLPARHIPILAHNAGDFGHALLERLSLEAWRIGRQQPLLPTLEQLVHAFRALLSRQTLQQIQDEVMISLWKERFGLLRELVDVRWTSHRAALNFNAHEVGVL